MRLTLTTFVTLDGVMQGPGAPEEDRSGGFELGGWLPPHFDEGVAAFMSEIFDRADAFLLGRRTYQAMAGFWPSMTDPDDRVARQLNALPKHVATNTLTDLDWPGATRLDGEVLDAVAALKERAGRELQIHGSGTLARTLMQHGAIDAYNVLVFPVVLGRGRKLFADDVEPTALKLTDSRTTGSGVVMVRYEPAGQPTRGSVNDGPITS